ncbi:hypothetical protein [Spirosoma linguale]|uniref:Uncharacterized protein n=1 Tax=Spirosoma linguale (strain ATCC 33905 / DSM 74 / LMG 10896 / Claus 1) TaxID=504472 RepID=D2QEW0_SPILD|nr:hypothetical protein Slin_5335 [Spirosoma linguale DSM 74]
MDKLDKYVDQWLNDADLFEIADSLLFEIRLDERLEFVYNTHVQVNGIRIFDAFIVRFEQIKRELDKPLREEMKGWNAYIIQEKTEGRIPDLEGIPTLAELRKDQGYPTDTLFPHHWRKMTHISWQYVEDVKTIVREFKHNKKSNSLEYTSVECRKLNSKNVPYNSIDVKGNSSAIGFDVYVNEKYRGILMPYLIKEYTGKKPKQFGYMLYALNTLGLIGVTTMANQTQLYEDLKITFGEVGTRQRLQQLINELSRASSNEEINIKRHIHSIKAHLQSGNTDNLLLSCY